MADWIKARREISMKRLRDGSNAEQVELNLFVAVFARPQVERCAGRLVYEGIGTAELAEVDRFEIVTAALASIDTLMRESRRLEVPELPLVFFVAVRTQDATKRPWRETRGAQQQPTAAISGTGAPGFENRKLRHPAALRATIINARPRAIQWRKAFIAEPLSIRLENRLRKELAIRWRAPVVQQRFVGAGIST